MTINREEIARLVAAATPGPWRQAISNECRVLSIQNAGNSAKDICETDIHDTTTECEANAALIAHVHDLAEYYLTSPLGAETCSYCNGSGLCLNYGGDPGICPECKGDTVVTAVPETNTSALGAAAMQEAAKNVALAKVQMGDEIIASADMLNWPSVSEIAKIANSVTGSIARAIDALPSPSPADQLAAALRLPQIAALVEAAKQMKTATYMSDTESWPNAAITVRIPLRGDIGSGLLRKPLPETCANFGTVLTCARPNR